MLNIAVCISGGGTDLQSLIDACKDHQIDGQIKLVISNRKSAYGLVRAQKAGIKNEVIKDEEEILKRLEEEKIDLIVLAGYLAIVGDKMISKYKNRIINIHPSLVPSFCGAGMYGLHVHEAVFNRGVKVSGLTIHFVSHEVDGGPIILQHAVAIEDCHSPLEIQQKILTYEHILLPRAVQLFCEGKLKVIDEKVEIKK